MLIGISGGVLAIACINFIVLSIGRSAGRSKVLSVALIIATVVIMLQLSFMHTKDLGFQKEHVVMLAAQGTDYKLFRQLIESHTAASSITASSIGLGAGEGQMGGRCDLNGRQETVLEYPVAANFLDVMGETHSVLSNFTGLTKAALRV